MREPLPIDPHIAEIVDAVRRTRAAVITAAPGAGKTTRVPPALIDDGPLILLQPRRVAARAIARRIAGERGWSIGREIGWQVRFERRFSGDTRLLVATEGVLAARLQRDPLLSDFRTIVLDEFHERSIHLDVGIALARQAWRARADLRVVVMSATLDASAVAQFLDDCPVVDVPGRSYPLDITYHAGQHVADAAVELSRTSGDVLCFLPGAFEIRQTIADLERRTQGSVDVVPLFGALSADEQDRALRPRAGRRRVVVATNVAETSLTVPGITAVVDSGLHKVARFDADRAIDSLTTERITADSADQRAGRAGRVAPGVVRRLWDARVRLRPHREPEIQRVDLAAAVLDVLAWGGDPRTFDWFEAPRLAAIERAMALLERLGAVERGTLTTLGRTLQRFPLHPRLARIVMAGGGAVELTRACAVIAEGQIVPVGGEATSSDLLSAIDRWDSLPPHAHQAAREIQQMVAGVRSGGAGRTGDRRLSESEFRRAILAGYPDRVGQRREPGSARVKLATGAGAVVAAQSGVRDGEFLVAVDVHASARSNEPDSLIRVASRVEREWLEPNAIEVVHRFDEGTATVRAAEVERYDALTLAERPVSPDPAMAANLLVDAWMARGPQPDDVQMLRRIRFAGLEVALDDAIRTAAYGRGALGDVALANAIAPDVLRTIDRNAPERLLVPSGREVLLEYTEDGGVTAAVKLQELFGLADTPRLGPRQAPVLFALLAPNGRPVQMTRDLRSFWERTYPEVRKELRGRYPKHPWPQDPWHATPTARPVPKKRS